MHWLHLQYTNSQTTTTTSLRGTNPSLNLPLHTDLAKVSYHTPIALITSIAGLQFTAWRKLESHIESLCRCRDIEAVRVVVIMLFGTLKARAAPCRHLANPS
jgi:hypothetical protein